MLNQPELDFKQPVYPTEVGYQRGSENSKAAAEGMRNKAKVMRSHILAMVACAGQGGLTTEQAAIELDCHNSSVGARFRELELMGCITRTGAKRTNKDKTREIPLYKATGTPIPTNMVRPKYPTRYQLGKHDGYLTVLKAMDEMVTGQHGWPMSPAMQRLKEKIEGWVNTNNVKA